MNCEEIKSLLVDYINNCIEANEEAALKEHLSICQVCCDEIRVLTSVQQEFSMALQEMVNGTCMPAKTLQKIKRRLKPKFYQRLNKSIIKDKLYFLMSRPIWQKAVAVLLIMVIIASAFIIPDLLNSNKHNGLPIYSLSGSVSLSSIGLQGVTITLTGASSATAITNANGNYSFTGLVNGSYTITPNKSGYVFNPASSAQTISSAVKTGVKFSAISGISSATAVFGSMSLLGINEIYALYITNDGEYHFARLTDNRSYYKQPTLSPDGLKIAFTSIQDGNGEIYIMSYDGSNPTRLTNKAGNDESPVWSPDGTKIAFIARPNEESEELYVMNSDGSGQIKLSSGFTIASSPSWSSDNRKIAFNVKQNDNWDIYVIDVDGSNLKRLTDNPETDMGPAWSPDGKKIAFVSQRNGFWELYLMYTDGSNQVKLTTQEILPGKPSWSPSGNKIACFYGSELYVFDADGSNLNKLTSLNKRSPIFNCPVWSRDGSKLSFTYLDILSSSSPETVLYVINSDGTNLTDFIVAQQK